MGIILASSSPRRKKILEKLGYKFDIKIPNIDEDNINNLNPVDYVIDVSMRKGLKIHQKCPTDYVISGDTIIEFENKIKDICLDAFKILGSNGWGRVDFFIDGKNNIKLIELNSIPGMTSHSLVPMSANKIGWTYTELIEKILLTDK